MKELEKRLEVLEEQNKTKKSRTSDSDQTRSL